MRGKIGTRVKLTQLSSSHTNVRTKETVGECFLFPRVGNRFTMTSEPLDPTKDLRLIDTSPAKSVEIEDNVYYFETQNSKYKLEILDV